MESGDAMLKYTNIEIGLLTDYEGLITDYVELFKKNSGTASIVKVGHSFSSVVNQEAPVH